MAFCRFVSRPKLIFKYEIDEILYSVGVGAIPIVIGIFTTHLISGIIFGFITGYIFLVNYKKFAKNRTPGLMIHFFYDIGILDPNKKKDKTNIIPPGFINEFNE